MANKGVLNSSFLRIIFQEPNFDKATPIKEREVINSLFIRETRLLVLSDREVLDNNCLKGIGDTSVNPIQVFLANSNTGFLAEEIDLFKLISTPNLDVKSRYFSANKASKITRSSPSISYWSSQPVLPNNLEQC